MARLVTQRDFNILVKRVDIIAKGVVTLMLDWEKVNVEVSELRAAVDTLLDAYVKLRDIVNSGAADAEKLEEVARSLDNIEQDVKVALTPKDDTGSTGGELSA